MAIRNCLIGCAVGDALGFIVEGYDADTCCRYVDTVILPGLVPIMTRLPQFTFGQYSDDTQLTREFVCHLTQTGGRIDANLYATRIAMLFAGRAPDIVGYGRQTRNAAARVMRGVEYSKSGCKKGQGNGGVMRSAIIGVAMYGHPREEVSSVAMTLSAITHASPACQKASSVVALAAQFFAIKQGPFDVAAFFEYISFNQQHEVEIVKELCALGTTHEIAKYRIIEYAVDKNKERSWPGCISYGVWQTTMWALWCVVQHPDDYIAAISEAIKVGGDVDTTAAIVGAIIATRCGETSIPLVYREALHDVDKWAYRDLCDLADRAARVACSGR